MNRLATILAVVLILFGVGFSARAEEKQARRQVGVYVECIVVQDGKPQTYTAYYCVFNPNAYAVMLPYGPQNHWEQERAWDQGQPTVFAPGKSSWQRTVEMWMDTPGGGYSGWWSHPTWWYLDGRWAFADGYITKPCR